MKTKDYFTKFESYLLTEKRVAKNTFDAYRRDLEQFSVFLDTQKLALKKVTPTDLKAYLKYLNKEGIGARSAARKISTLKAFYIYLEDRYEIKNCAEELITPRLEQKLPKHLKEKEVEMLLSAAKEDDSDAGVRNCTMLYLLYVTGMRISELVHVTVSSVDFSSGFVTVPGKGGKERMVPLPHHMSELLKNYLKNVYPQLVTKKNTTLKTDYMFPTFYGGKLKAMSRQMFWIYLKDMGQRAGIKHELSPHQLRHSLATHLLKKGANLRSLQMLLGHENLTTVQIYTHVETEHLRKIYDKKHPRS
ncbi:MAG: integrase/recombinase XerD [Alteromonas naphthalenivorans]|jgi:integrase/recombinase XerD